MLKYIKFMNDSDKHYNKQYRTGHHSLKKDDKTWNPDGDCEPGGYYFVSLYGSGFVQWWQGHYNWIREVILPDTSKVVEQSENKLKCNEFILGDRMSLKKKSTWEWLIANGLDVNAKDNDGLTALHWASCNGYKDIVELLIKHVADVNAKDNDGETALHWASRYGCKEIVKLLIKHGVDVNIKDNNGWTALYGSSRYGYQEIVKLLIKHGVDVNAKDNDGFTALYFVSCNGYKDIVELLMNQDLKKE